MPLFFSSQRRDKGHFQCEEEREISCVTSLGHTHSQRPPRSLESCVCVCACMRKTTFFFFFFFQTFSFVLWVAFNGNTVGAVVKIGTLWQHHPEHPKATRCCVWGSLLWPAVRLRCLKCRQLVFSGYFILGSLNGVNCCVFGMRGVAVNRNHGSAKKVIEFRKRCGEQHRQRYRCPQGGIVEVSLMFETAAPVWTK